MTQFILNAAISAFFGGVGGVAIWSLNRDLRAAVAHYRRLKEQLNDDDQD